MTLELNNRQRESLYSLSVALRYPDEAFEAELAAEVSVTGELELSGLKTFAEAASRLRTASLQEVYLQTFESDPHKSLYLSWHRYGDDPTRGRALAALNELYTDAGFESVGGELPDYVPAVLEFMAEAPDWATAVLLDGFGSELSRLAERIASSGSVYAPLMADLSSILQPLVPQQETRTRPVV